MSVSAWEAVFMLVVLKIPIVYLCGVVWWAIRSEPSAEYGTAGGDSSAPVAPCGWDDSRRRARSPVGTRPFPQALRPSPRSRVGTSS